jgi:hypothetical protein
MDKKKNLYSKLVEDKDRELAVEELCIGRISQHSVGKGSNPLLNHLHIILEPVWIWVLGKSAGPDKVKVPTPTMYKDTSSTTKQE